MSERTRQIIFLISTIFLCLSAMFGMTYLSLLPKASVVEGKQEYVSAAQQDIEAAGMLFEFPFGSTFINFDFKNSKTQVLFLSAEDNQTLKYGGYKVFKKFICDYDFLARFIDRFSGVTLPLEGGEQRLTGIQIVELLPKLGSAEDKKAPVLGLLSNIADKGFAKTDLAFLIENTETDLSFPEGYSLLPLLSGAMKSIECIN